MEYSKEKEFLKTLQKLSICFAEWYGECYCNEEKEREIYEYARADELMPYAEYQLMVKNYNKRFEEKKKVISNNAKSLFANIPSVDDAITAVDDKLTICHNELETYQYITHLLRLSVLPQRYDSLCKDGICTSEIEYGWYLFLNEGYKKKAEITPLYFSHLCKYSMRKSMGGKAIYEEAKEYKRYSVKNLLQNFIVRLDMLLLGRGMNIEYYQQETGVYVSTREERIKRLSEAIGNVNLVEEYVSMAELKNAQNGFKTACIDKELPDKELPLPDKKLPESLNADAFKAILSKAIELGFIAEAENGYQWKGTKSLCAYFASMVSIKLGLCNKVYGTKTAISWMPFEQLFGICGLKHCQSSWEKSGELPRGNGDIDKIFA